MHVGEILWHLLLVLFEFLRAQVSSSVSLMVLMSFFEQVFFELLFETHGLFFDLRDLNLSLAEASFDYAIGWISKNSIVAEGLIISCNN